MVLFDLLSSETMFDVLRLARGHSTPTTTYPTVTGAGDARISRPLRRTIVNLLALILAFSSVGGAQERDFALESVAGLRLHNVTAEAATLRGKKGIRVTMPEAAQRQFESKSREEQNRLATTGGTVDQIAVIEGLEFDNGVIQAEIAGAPKPGAFAGARGFVGLAFRVQNDNADI